MDASVCVRSRLEQSPVISGLICAEIAAKHYELSTRLDARACDDCRRNDDAYDDVLLDTGSFKTNFSCQQPGDHR